jgi:hypothetical protein
MPGAGSQASFNTNQSFTSSSLMNFVNLYPGSKLGGGLPGFIPQALITTNNNNEFAETRFTLKNAWNTNYARKVNNQAVLLPAEVLHPPLPPIASAIPVLDAVIEEPSVS